MKKLLILVACTHLASCNLWQGMTAVEEVKPWQRGTLARDDMTIPHDAIHEYVEEHIYFSKESSTGGNSIGGGGCGCN